MCAMKVTVSRKAHFNAAHRLYNPSWSDEENARVFGKCNNEYFHGHNYELIVSITGTVNEKTGYVVDMKWLAEIIEEHVENRFDHKNLNVQCSDFKNLNPTAENIAIVIWNILEPLLDEALELKVTLFETPRNFVEYTGN
jgi:6-pyruvoyltetrahydropterin/6-carboxytetrahydropterin synthase